MVIMGIDPGTAVTGYGVVSVKNNTVTFVDYGVICTRPDMALPLRLSMIYDGLVLLMDRHKPSRVGIEEAFYAKNVHTTLLLGHARGVAMLAAYKAGAEVAEYAPREIKKSVTGNGNATKEGVEYMIKTLLKPGKTTMKSDAYDALAVAVCDFYNAGNRAINDTIAEAVRRTRPGLRRVQA